MNAIDTIVIGGSAGSFAGLKQLLSDLPGDTRAAILVCQHIAHNVPRRTPELLQNHTELSLHSAEDGQAIREGHVYFAPPGCHLLMGDDHLHLRKGAHENNFRPAIDPLFRSAAVYRGPRAVGVILSGLLDDGAAGARALARMGGRILVQSPEEARYPDMPEATLGVVPEARAVPLGDMATELLGLVGNAIEPGGPVPWDIGVELKIAALEGASIENEEKLGVLSPYNCPSCNGVLWEIEDGPMTRFRCHTGHAFTLENLETAQNEALELALFNALRVHRGRAALVERLARRAVTAESRERYARRLRLVKEDAERLEDIIRNRSTE